MFNKEKFKNTATRLVLVTVVAFCSILAQVHGQDTTFVDSTTAEDFTQQVIKGFVTEDIKSGRNIPTEAEPFVKKGERLFYEGPMKYDKAIIQFKKALMIAPHSAYINFKIGECYLLGNRDKIKSVTYLEKAFHENKRIDHRVHLFLGRSFHLNMDMQRAIEEYNLYIAAYSKKQRFKEETPDDSTITSVRRFIVECETGIELIADPKRFLVYNLGPNVNSSFPDYDPFLMGNDTILIFTSRREDTRGGGRADVDAHFYEDVFLATKKGSGWKKAKAMSGKFNKRTNNAVVGVSGDGKTMFMYRDIERGNIYETHLEDGEWTRPKSMKFINTEYRETSACMTRDGKTMYYVSDKPGGLGGGDIYVIKKDTAGEWLESENIGSLINSEYDEGRVFISRDNNFLYFSSRGHRSMGGYDIFVSELDSNGNWSMPENIGYPINTVDDDISFSISPNMSRGYYSSIKPNGIGSKDIYMVSFLDFLKPVHMETQEAKVTVEMISVTALYPREEIEIRDSTEIALSDSTNAEQLENILFLKEEVASMNYDNSEAEKIKEIAEINLKSLQDQAEIEENELEALKERLNSSTDSTDIVALSEQITEKEASVLNLKDRVSSAQLEVDSVELALKDPNMKVLNLSTFISAKHSEVENLEEVLKTTTDSTIKQHVEELIALKEDQLLNLEEELRLASIAALAEDSTEAALASGIEPAESVEELLIIAEAELIKLEEEKKAAEAEQLVVDNKITELNAQASAKDYLINELEQSLDNITDSNEIKRINDQIVKAKDEKAIMKEQVAALGSGTPVEELLIISEAELVELGEEKKAEEAAIAAAEEARIEEEKKAEEAATAAAEKTRIEEEKKVEEAAIAAAEEARIEEEKKVEEAAIAAAEEARVEEEKKVKEAATAAAEEARVEEEKKVEGAAIAAAEEARIEEKKKSSSSEQLAMESKIRDTKIMDLNAKASANDKLITELESKLEGTTDPEEIKQLTTQIEENKGETARINEELIALKTGITTEEARIEEEKKSSSSEQLAMESKIRDTKIMNLNAKASANDKLITELESKLEGTTDPEEIKQLTTQIEENKGETARINEELIALKTGITTEEASELSAEEIAKIVEEKKAEVAAATAAEEKAKIAAEEARIEEEKKTEEVAELAAEEARIEAEKIIQAQIKAKQDSIDKAITAQIAETTPMTAADSIDAMEPNSKELPLIRKEIKMLQLTIGEREDELKELEALLENSDTPDEIVHLVEQIEDRKTELGVIELQLASVVKSLDGIGKDSTEIESSTSVVNLTSKMQDMASEINALEQDLENSMIPERIVELIIIMDDKKLELELLEEALQRAETQEKTQVLNLRTLVTNKEIELSGLNDKLTLAATEEGKANIQAEIDLQQRELDKMMKELAVTEFLASADDRDGDGSADNIDQCPDIAGPTNNKGCPLKLYLLGGDMDTVGFAYQNKDGAFLFEKLKNHESYVFVLDVFDVDVVDEVKVQFTDENGNIQFISASKDDGKIFRYQYIPYTLHLINGEKDTMLSVMENDEGVFVFQKLNDGKNQLFVLEGKEVDLVDQVMIDITKANGEVQHITAVKKQGQEFEYDPLSTATTEAKTETETETKETAAVDKEEGDPILPLFTEPSDTVKAAVLSKGTSYLLNNILFEFDRSNIHAESFPELDKLVAMLRGKPSIKAEISGHTDHKGPASYNQLLSERRSAAVVNYLVNKGIPANRLIIKGYGESRPIAPNTFPDGSDNPEGREKNRRTEIRILE